MILVLSFRFSLQSCFSVDFIVVSVHDIFESFILNGQTYFQRPNVSSHPFAGNGAVEAGVLLDWKFLREVEDCLFPVCGLDMRSSAEHDTQFGEIKENIKIATDS